MSKGEIGFKERFFVYTRKKIGLFFLIGFIIIQLFACSRTEETNVVMTVENEPIQLNELTFYLRQIEQDFESFGGKDIWQTDFDGRAASEVAKERAVDSLFRIKVLCKKSKEMGILLTEEEERQIEEQAYQIFQNIDEKQKEELNLSKALMIKITREGYLAEKVYNEVTKDFVPNEQLIQDKISDDLGDLKNEEPSEILKRAKGWYIFIHKEDGSQNDKTKVARANLDQKLAEEAARRAKAGEDFQELVEKYSQDDGNKDTGGAFEYRKGEMSGELADVVFAIEPGDISDVIETADGYYIVKLAEIIKPDQDEIIEYTEKINNLGNQLRDQYTELQKQEAFEKQYSEWKDQYKMEFNQELWDDIHVNNES